MRWMFSYALQHCTVANDALGMQPDILQLVHVNLGLPMCVPISDDNSMIYFITFNSFHFQYAAWKC